MTQVPTNEKDSLNIEETKSFLNLWLLAISLMVNYFFFFFSEVSDTSIKTLA